MTPAPEFDSEKILNVANGILSLAGPNKLDVATLAVATELAIVYLICRHRADTITEALDVLRQQSAVMEKLIHEGFGEFRYGK